MREDWDKGRGPGSKLGGQDTVGIAGMLAGRWFFLRGVGGRGLGAAGPDSLLSADTQR